MTIDPAGLKYPQFENLRLQNGRSGSNMNPIQNPPFANQSSEKKVMEKMCRHPRVRVVARDDDAEFVECQECGDVFEASEFRDMAIEENIRPDEA